MKYSKCALGGIGAVKNKYSLMSVDDDTAKQFEINWNSGSRIAALMRFVEKVSGKKISQLSSKKTKEIDKVYANKEIKGATAAIKIINILNK